jgi:hypothetical protein
MDGVVSSVRNGDQVVGVEETVVSGLDLLDGDRVQMVNVETAVNLVTIDPKIASVVSDDDSVPGLTPLTRRVEVLVDPSVESKSRFTDSALESKVAKPLYESFESANF